jgi:hypothetical protein
MSKKVLTITLLTFAVLIIGCSKDDNPASGNSSNLNNPPVTPYHPTPADGATNVDWHFITLQWNCSDPDPGDTLTYDIYFSGSNPPGIFSSNCTKCVFDIGIVPPNARLYWKIVAKDNRSGVTTGPIWQFHTSP